MSIVRKIIYAVLLLIIFLLLYKNCSSRKMLVEYERTIRMYDSISNLPPIIEIDTFFKYKDSTVHSIPVRIRDTVYLDTIKTSDINIYISDTISSDSTIRRTVDYSLINPIVTYREIEKVPIIQKEKQKRVLVVAGLGSDIHFKIPVASIGANYLFDKWSIGAEVLYNRDISAKVNVGIRF